MIDSLKAYELARMAGGVAGAAAAASRRQLDEGPGAFMRTVQTLFNSIVSDPSVKGRGRSFGGAFEGPGRYMTAEDVMVTRKNRRGQRGTQEVPMHGVKKYTLDDVALGNLQKDYGDFFRMLKLLSKDQMDELTKALNKEAGQFEFDFNSSKIADLLVKSGIGFKEKDLENLGAIFQNLDDASDSRLFAIDRYEGTQDLKGFKDLVERVLNFSSEASKATEGINKAAEEAQVSFTRIKSGITRLTETLGAMAKSLDNIKKVRKAFSGERIDLLGKAGAGLSIGGFAQAQSRAQFGDDRAKLTATTAAANATKIMDQIKKGEGVSGDIEERALKDAAELFTTNIEKGLDAFAKFTTVNAKAQEGITKLINKLRQTYRDQLKNIELDQKITEAKTQLEQKRRENTEKQLILTDAMAAVEHRRAVKFIDANAQRQGDINKIQGKLDDPRQYRGSLIPGRDGGLPGRARGGRIIARALDQQRIADMQFEGKRDSAVNASVAKANALIVQKQQVQLDNQLLKSQTSLITTIEKLIFEYQRQSNITAMGARPIFSEEDAKRLGYGSIKDARLAGGDMLETPAQMEYDKKRAGFLNERAPISITKIGNPLLPENFNYDAEEKAAANLAKTLENVSTQEEVITALRKRRDELGGSQADKAEKRRIDTLLREINLGQKRLTTEKEISDELRQQTRDRGVSLDQDARSFKTQFKEGMLDIFEETDYIYARLGRDLPMAFRDGMVGAMEAAMDKADSFGDAMKGVAVDMLKMIRRAALEHSMSNFTNLLGMGTKGFRTSQHGSIVPGSGTGDKVPTMLEPGEYVMNRKAVKGIGKTNLDNMNFGAFPRFAEGGSMMLNESATSNRMSGFFLASDNPELMEAREKARADYEKKQAKKAEKRQLLSSFLSTIASVGMGKLMDMGASAWKNRGLTKEGKQLMGGKLGTSSSFMETDPSNPYRQRLGSGKINVGNSTFNMLPATGGPAAGGWGTPTQKGGHIGQGFSNRDSVPAYMAGGEFVMNSRAVRKYGTGFMGRLNGGLIPSMQAGGAVGGAPAPLNTQTGANTNNISINVNMGGGGGAAGQGASDSSGNANASEQSNVDQSTRAKELGERIRSSVLQVITEEQRLGGSLSKKSRG